MTTTILVSGATGTIGREILAALAAHSEARVLVGTRDPGRAAEQLRHLPGVRAVELDMDRPETVAVALTGVDKLAVVSPMTPAMAQQTDVLVSAARRAGVGHIVRSSLMGVDEPDPIVEADWHGAADAAVRQSGIPFTILRPTQFFQNFLNFGNRDSVRDQGMIYLPLGQSHVSNIDTRDIGACVARVLLTPGTEHHGRAYVLTGGESVTMDEVAQAMSEALGKTVRYVPVEEAQYRQGMLGAGIPEVIADAILGWFAYCRAGRADRVE
ncbi:MAG TPA: SDR family oxidoreductase, partial [Haliangium sp.]|nr:SDR family oxidoreductase [Haliangium sp.]